MSIAGGKRTGKMKGLQHVLAAVAIAIPMLATAQTFTGPTEVCQNKGYSYTYYDDVQYNSIEWSASGGGTIVKTVGLQATAKFSSSGSITVELYYYGSLRSSDTKNVSVYSPGSLSGPSQSCSGSAVSLSISGGTGSTFMWQYSTDGTNFYNIGSYGTSITQYPTTTTYYRSYPSTCSNTPSNVKTVTVYPYPTAYTVGGGGGFCSGGGGSTVSLNGSQSDVSYQLKLNGSNYGSAVGGNGGALYWYTLKTTGTYTVSGTRNGCTTNMTSSAYVFTNVLPDPYAVGGGGAYCEGGPGVTVTLSTSQNGVNYQLKANGINQGSPLAGNGVSLTWYNQTTVGTYSVLATNTSTGCAQTMSGSASVSTQPVPVGGSITPANPQHFTTTNSGTLTLSGYSGTIQRWEKNTGAGWVTISNTNSTLNYSGLTQTTNYRVAVDNSLCSEVYSAEAVVTINPAPVVVKSLDAIPYGGSSMLSVTTSYDSYQWYNGNPAQVIQGATDPTYNAIEPGIYRVRVTDAGISSYGDSQDVVIVSLLDMSILAGGKKNLKSITRILTPGVTSASNLYSLSSDEIAQTLDYQDGLGRTFQVIGVGQSPDGKDVVQPVGYSQHGLVETSYLPYVASNKTGLLRNNAIDSSGTYTTSDQYKFYQNTSGVTHDAYPYATKVLSSSPLMTLKEQGAPGYDWQSGNGHTIKNDRVLNVASEVHYWKTDGTTNSYYTPNTLAVSLVTDENGNKVKTYSDKMGRTILKKVEADGNVESLSWLETYYIYDEYGRVKYQVPPKAMAVLGTGSTLDVNDSAVAELIFKYTYDYLGRVVEKKVPGAAVEYIVYDQLDRVVLTQDANLRTEDKWMFVKYDIKERPVYNGWYVNSGSRTTVQGLLDALDYDASDKWYEEEAQNASYQGYTNQGFPTTNTTLLSVNYYDDYDFDHNGSPDYTYDNTHFTGQAASASTRTRGLPTGSKRRIINSAGVTSDWLIGVTFYDEYDRPIQSQSNNQLYLAGIDKQTTVYDFVKPLKSKTTHNSSASVALNIADSMAYDHMGRVTSLYRKIGSNPEQAIAQYNYNELGQLLNKKLHDTGSGWLQQVDYTYTIRGWLNKINDPSNIGNDYFAMEMYYNESLGALSQASKYNGNITAIKWKEGFGNDLGTDTKAFAYSYYKNDQLQKASYGEGASFALNANAYNEEGLTYDANGNISTLQRKGKSETGTVTTIDNLTYTYAGNSLNRLAQVEDASSNDQGFKNGATSSSEFTYDNGGNVKKDLNKGIDSIAYNELNKVKAVYFTGGKNLKYTYDATGAKLAMEEYDNTTLIKSTKYVGGFVYENDTLRYFASPEGRVVVDNGTYEYQYALGDHQGNTRTVFTSKEETMQFNATFETSGSGLREDTDLFENVDSGNEVSFTAANHTPSGSKVYRMNQSNSAGPGLMLRVYPGDVINPEVYAYHENSTGYGTNSAGLSSMIAAIAGAFGGQSGGSEGQQAIFDAFDDALTVLGLGGNQGDDRPAAYLNYLFFDETNGFDYQNQDDDYGWKEVPAGAYYSKALVQLDSAIKIKVPGYLYIYLSYENESNNYVYFDDLKINYQKSQIVQSNNYYAFGLQTKDSWTRIDTKPNQYLYNAGSELNEATSHYEMMFRSYDPAIGRMSGVDPMVNSFASITPYNYSFNDPVYWNDPSGAVPEKVWDNGGKYEDSGSGGGSSIFINGRLMNPRNNYGQREWADGTDSYSYLEFMSSVDGITSPVGIRIGDKALKDFERDINGKYVVKCDYCGGELKRYTDTYTWDGTNLLPTGTTLVFNPMMITLGQMFSGYNSNGGYPNTHSQSEGNAFEIAGAFVGAFETGTAIGLHQTTKGGTAVLLAKKGAYLGGKTLSKTLGGIGIGLTAANLVYEYNTGNINTHSFVDAGIAIGTFAAGAIALTVGAPVIAVGAAVVGIGYGIFSIAGGESLIDNASGNWGSKLIYGGK